MILMISLAMCSGSLISPNVVLTAGHCQEDSSDSLVNLKPIHEIEKLRIRAGTWDASNGGKMYRNSHFV